MRPAPQGRGADRVRRSVHLCWHGSLRARHRRHGGCAVAGLRGTQADYFRSPRLAPLAADFAIHQQRHRPAYLSIHVVTASQYVSDHRVQSVKLWQPKPG